MCVCGVHMCVENRCACVWGAEDNPQTSVFSFHHMGPETQIQIVRLHSKHLSLLSQLIGLNFLRFILCFIYVGGDSACVQSALGSQERRLESLKLQSWMVISCLVRMLGLQLRSSGRAVCAHERTHKTHTPRKTHAWRSGTTLGTRFSPSTAWVQGSSGLGARTISAGPVGLFERVTVLPGQPQTSDPPASVSQY